MSEYTIVQLITEDLFKQYSPVTDNTDVTEFIPYIIMAQELYLEDILGEPLMSELKNQIQTNTLTPENSALIIKIAPVLSHYAVYQGLPFHWASIVNKGITIRNSENSKSANIKDISQLRRWIKDDAEIFAKQLVTFLCRCRSNYPLWRPKHDCCDKVVNEGSATVNFDSGFYFPKRDPGCGCQ